MMGEGLSAFRESGSLIHRQSGPRNRFLLHWVPLEDRMVSTEHIKETNPGQELVKPTYLSPRPGAAAHEGCDQTGSPQRDGECAQLRDGSRDWQGSREKC